MRNIRFVGSSWNWLFLVYGPVKMIDGLILTLSFGLIMTTFASDVSLAMARKALR